jgi:hypothetical protein
MKLKLTRNLGTETIKAIGLHGAAKDFVEGIVLDLDKETPAFIYLDKHKLVEEVKPEKTNKAALASA